MKTKEPKLTKQQAARNRALDLLRTQAFNWALSVGFNRTRERYEALDAICHELATDWNIHTQEDTPERAVLHYRLCSIEEQMHGLIDAGERENWLA